MGPARVRRSNGDVSAVWCQQADRDWRSGVTDDRTAVCHATGRIQPAAWGREDINPMSMELFIETDAEDLVADEDWRRCVRRSQRARSAMVVRPLWP